MQGDKDWLAKPCLKLYSPSCTGPSPDALEPKPKQLLNDLKHAQVKILSFLTWMLRTFPNMVAPHQVSTFACSGCTSEPLSSSRQARG